MFRKLVILVLFTIIFSITVPVHASNQCNLYVGVEKGTTEPGGIYKMLTNGEYYNVTEKWGFAYNFFQAWALDGSILVVAGNSRDDLDLYTMNDNPIGLELIRDLPKHDTGSHGEFFPEFTIYDGKIAYTYGGQLYIGDVDTPEADSIITYFGPEYFLETFSDNSESYTLIPPENDFRPQFVSDLTWINGDLYFFYRHEVEPEIQSLLQYNLDSGHTNWIDENVSWHSRINRLNDAVGYIQKEGNFFNYVTYDIESGRMWEIISHYTQIWQPSWSSNYKQLAFVSNVDMGWNVLIYNNYNREINELTFGGSTKDTPVWSPDQSVIYVNYTAGGNREVARIDQTGNLTVVSDFGTRVYVIGFQPGCDP